MPFEETQQTSEPDIEGMLALLDQEFNTTVINMLCVLIDKVDSMQDRQAMQAWGRNPEKVPKRNARNKKHKNKSKELLWWAY